MELATVFGRNVRNLREAQMLTQEELARRAQINRSYLSAVERGQRRICLENIARIAHALGVSADVLFKSSGTVMDSSVSKSTKKDEL